MSESVTAEQVNTTAAHGMVQDSPIPDSPRDDVRADVMAAYEKLSKSNPADGQVAAADTDGGAPSPDRLRNERGQFIKADEASVEAAPAEPVTDAGTPQDTPQEPSQVLAAPKGWSADAKAKWSTLDPSIQAEVLKRETDIDNGGRQWSEEKRAYEQVLTPLRDFSSKYGIDDRAALTRLLDWQRALEESPAQAIMQLAQLSGVDLNNPIQQQQSQPVLDPRLDSLLPTISELQANHVNSIIDSFKAAPGHEHFDKVRVAMGQLMERTPGLSMDQAYEQAIWLDPEVRSALIQQQVQPTQQRAKEQQQVAKAKAAAASPKGSGPNGDAPRQKQEHGSLRDTVLAAARDAGWAV